jgi:hypothetical protein
MTSRPALREQFDSLTSIHDSAEAGDKRRRGRLFEEFLKQLLMADGLSPRIRIRPDGEEIDGSFVLNDRLFLLEAKWHSLPVPAGTIYQFKGKVDGKLVGTLGTFISMSDFTKEAVDALTVGKAINVVLFGRSDIESAIDREAGFRTVLLRKLRLAAEEGIVYIESKSSVATPTSPDVQVVDEGEPAVRQDVVVIVEGTSDERVLAELTRRIIQHEGLPVNVRFMAAGGKQAVTRLCSLVRRQDPPRPPSIVVADTDGDRCGTEVLLRAGLQRLSATLVLIEPEMEAWLFPGVSEPKAVLQEEARHSGKQPAEYAVEVARALSLESLRNSNSDFSDYYRSILAAARLAQDRPSG